MAITRTAWIDDDGTGTTGTVINNAEKTLLYDQIDAVLAGYLPAPAGRVTGPVTITAGPADGIALNLIGRPSSHDTAIFFYSNNGTTLNAHLGASPSGLTINSRDAANIQFTTGTLVRGTIGVNGHWGINCAPDAVTAEVGTAIVTVSNVGHSAIGLAMQSVVDGKAAVYGFHTLNGAGGYAAIFYNTGAGTGVALTNTGAWAAISDRRRKTDIRDIEALGGLRQLRPRDFLWTTHAESDRPGQRNYGFVAQEVEDIYPHLVSTGSDALLSLNYDGFIAPLVQGWQDHDRRLAHLETLIAERMAA